jgi:predicted  nucleic acid-binding Zn-ribbon protein
VLIGAFIALLFSSAGDLPGQGFIDTINAFVKQGITEPDRKKAVSADVADMEEALEDFSKRLKSAGKLMVKLNKDYGSSREALESVLDELNRERAGTQQKILELRFSIRDQMSREEWQRAFGKP